VTSDRARKKAIRARMAASGEPFSVAARKLDAAPPAADAGDAGDAAVREIIARVNATLAAPSARIEYRRDAEADPSERPQPRRPGLAGRLARRAARAAWERIAPGVDLAQLAEGFTHQAGVGFVEPAARRYQIDYGAYAQAYRDGELFGGLPGAPLPANPGRPVEDDPLELLDLLRDALTASYEGEETLRGTICRAVAVHAGSAAFTVWIDGEHVRKIQSEWRGSRPHQRGSVRTTFELWDYGVAVGSLDWSRLPGFRATG
jgi:hypothetical protein